MTEEQVTWAIWALFALGGIVFLVTRLPMFKGSVLSAEQAQGAAVSAATSQRQAGHTMTPCLCCGKRAPTEKMPRQVNRRRDHVWNPHAERNYGMPPRAMVGVDADGADVLCAACYPVVERGLEAFLASQYGETVQLIAKQSRAAAAFEGGGMLSEARVALGVVIENEVKNV